MDRTAIRVDLNEIPFEPAKKGIEVNDGGVEVNKEPVDRNREAVEVNTVSVELNNDSVDLNSVPVSRNSVAFDLNDDRVEVNTIRYRSRDRRNSPNQTPFQAFKRRTFTSVNDRTSSWTVRCPARAR